MQTPCQTPTLVQPIEIVKLFKNGDSLDVKSFHTTFYHKLENINNVGGLASFYHFYHL